MPVHRAWAAFEAMLLENASVGLAAEGVVALIRQPELAIEGDVQALRFLAQALGSRGVTVPLEQVGHRGPG